MRGRRIGEASHPGPLPDARYEALLEAHLFADGPDPDVMPTAANYVTQATSGGEPTPGGVPVGLDADMTPMALHVEPDVDIDDLFDASVLIESLGLEPTAEVPRVRPRRGPRTKWHDAFISLDGIVLEDILSKRPSLLKSVPAFLKGQLRESYVVALEAAQRGRLRGDMQDRSRAWKLFLLLPRMLLHRPEGVLLIPKATFDDRFKRFNEGKWLEFLDECTLIAVRRSSAQNDMERRAARAEALVSLGEVSSARQALEVAELAPGNLSTLEYLQNTDRRPDALRSPMLASILDFSLAFILDMDKQRFIQNLRGPKKRSQWGTYRHDG